MSDTTPAPDAATSDARRRAVGETAYQVNVHADHAWSKQGSALTCLDCGQPIGDEAQVVDAVEQGLVNHPRFVLAPVDPGPDPLGLHRGL